MNLDLNGQLALVTGSTAGIGYAVAEALVRQGARVVLNGRTPEAVAKAGAALAASTGKAALISGIAADLAKAEGAAALAAELGSVDILINNLGIFSAAPFAETPDAVWQTMYEVNVMSGVRVSRHYLPGMLARGKGRIVFIASEVAVNVPADMIPYAASKAAQVALARGLAETTAGTAVTVNTVLPGPTRSAGVERFLDEVLPDGAGAGSGDRTAAEAEFLRRMRPTSLLGRFARPDEVASLVAYLASPAASATNGAAVRVEGGLLRSLY